jgi:hypothetical protein
MGYSLTYLGHALAALGDLAGAAEAYEAARQLRAELGQPSLCVDDQAGLADVALAQNDVAQARAQVEAVLSWIEANGTAGLDYPLRVYATCCRVLGALADGDAALARRAQATLEQAHAALVAQAVDIRDPALQRAFLENFPANREISAAWEQRAGGAQR